jgi:hypothetical protein
MTESTDVEATLRSVRRLVLAAVACGAALVLVAPPLSAKVGSISLAELASESDFIGIVRVDRVGVSIPLLRRPRATATIVQSWKGQAHGRVSFAASPDWTCDISAARKGEEAVAFIRNGSLAHAGRGRMPLFSRQGRTLAAVWPEVRLPKATATEAGPEPDHAFIRGVEIGVLREAVAKAAAEPD